MDHIPVLIILFCRSECKIHCDREKERDVQDFLLQPSEVCHLARNLRGLWRILTAGPQMNH